MKRGIARTILAIVGLIIGISLANTIIDGNVFNIDNAPENVLLWLKPGVYVFLGILFGIIFYLLSYKIIDVFMYVTRSIEKNFSKMSMSEIFLGVVGLIIGLIIAALVAYSVLKIYSGIIGSIVSAVALVLLAYLGWVVPTKRSKEINLPVWFRRNDKTAVNHSNAMPKVLDSSAIIDGRFFDICQTNIIEGRLVVPRFVLDELRHISDSSDQFKRVRGRRGLDMLSNLQESGKYDISIDDRDYEDLPEVDSKLLRFATEIAGMVITTDYNLNKVALVQGVPVFNVNDLANALRIIVTAGEEVTLTITKEGKEPNQGVAYFEDGTMIVVEGARNLIGSTVTAVVTSVLQTSAGRMVFAKLRD